MLFHDQHTLIEHSFGFSQANLFSYTTWGVHCYTVVTQGKEETNTIHISKALV